MATERVTMQSRLVASAAKGKSGPMSVRTWPPQAMLNRLPCYEPMSHERDRAPPSRRVPDLHRLESGARNQGGLYAPPKTLPPALDHKTMEMRTVDVRDDVDPDRKRVTQRSLRSPSRPGAREIERNDWAGPPPAGDDPATSHPTRSRVARRWLIGLGVTTLLVIAVAIVASESSQRTPKLRPIRTPARAAQSLRSPQLPPITATQIEAPAPSEPPTVSARVPARASPGAERPTTTRGGAALHPSRPVRHHSSSQDQPLF